MIKAIVEFTPRFQSWGNGTDENEMVLNHGTTFCREVMLPCFPSKDIELFLSLKTSNDGASTDGMFQIREMDWMERGNHLVIRVEAGKDWPHITCKDLNPELWTEGEYVILYNGKF